jgi:hypothetical protein
MRVAINPQFFRQWYDRLAKPIFYGGSFGYGDSYDSDVTDPYIVPVNKFALILSLTVNAARGQTTGYNGYITTNVQVALRETPAIYETVWAHSFKVGPREMHSYSDIGHMGFLREGDRLRWVIQSDPQGGFTQVFVHLWLAEYQFEG